MLDADKDDHSPETSVGHITPMWLLPDIQPVKERVSALKFFFRFAL
jgi:hypothetical protein